MHLTGDQTRMTLFEMDLPASIQPEHLPQR